MRRIALLVAFALSFLACPVRAQDVVGTKGIAIGAGSYFAEETYTFDVDQGFLALHWDGLVLPMNETSTGLAAELSFGSFRGNGVGYTVWSRNRTKLAGPLFGGADAKFMEGNPGDKVRADFDFRIVMGVHLLQAGKGHFDLEFHFLEEAHASAGSVSGPAQRRPISFAVVYVPTPTPMIARAKKP